MGGLRLLLFLKPNGHISIGTAGKEQGPSYAELPFQEALVQFDLLIPGKCATGSDPASKVQIFDQPAADIPAHGFEADVTNGLNAGAVLDVTTISEKGCR